MPPTVATSAVPSPLSRLETVVRRPAKANLKNLDVWKVMVGTAVQRCFSLAGLTQKEAAALVNVDQAQVARWIAGKERPQLDALFAAEALRQPLVQALAELAEAEIVVTVRLKASSR
jgi:predicted XRE-type DNA-binding protein